MEHYKLNDRQAKILASVVREYTLTATPISSQLLAEKYHSDLSSATIRNELAALEELGFLIKPHTSAGRVPSDAGYRYFVDRFLDSEKLSRQEKKHLEVEMLKTKAQNVRLSRTLAKMLSVTSNCLVISGLVDKNEFYDFGMHKLMDDPDFQELDEISKISATLDLIDENVERLIGDVKSGETKIYIGSENPIKEIKKCAMIVAPYKTEKGEQGILALIGPKRMHYGKNKSLIDFVKNLIQKDSAALILIVLFAI